MLYVVSLLNPMGVSGTFANDVADLPVVMQAAAVTGMWGVEFLVLYLPAALAATTTTPPQPAPQPAPAPPPQPAPVPTPARIRLHLRPAAVAIAVVALVLGGGLIRLSADPGQVRKVAAIATNQKQWAPDLATPETRDLVTTYVREIEASHRAWTP